MDKSTRKEYLSGILSEASCREVINELENFELLEESSSEKLDINFKTREYRNRKIIR